MCLIRLIAADALAGLSYRFQWQLCVSLGDQRRQGQCLRFVPLKTRTGLTAQTFYLRPISESNTTQTLAGEMPARLQLQGQRLNLEAQHLSPLTALGHLTYPDAISVRLRSGQGW